MIKIPFFTTPETNLICIYAEETRLETIDNIIFAIPDFTEREFVEIAENAIEKLSMLTDDEFSEQNFSEQFTDELI
jgi:hypothetical protein